MDIYNDQINDQIAAENIIKKIRDISKKKIRLMEVCGTHTTSILKSGIRSLLPENITLLSGPGCPVCVTSQEQIDTFSEAAKNLCIATFGDLIRVPGTYTSLEKEKAAGKDIRVVASAIDAINIAINNKSKNVVFLGVGFETTAPTIAGSVIMAKEKGVKNYFVICAHKQMPPALNALMNIGQSKIDGFILPGHVSMVIGTDAYLPFFNKYNIPCVVAGFSPIEILYAILNLVKQIESRTPKLENAYITAVSKEGNKKALDIMDKVFKTSDADWRGIGNIKSSGFKIRKEFVSFDALENFDIKTVKSKEGQGCICGDILIGSKQPPDCPLYKKKCTPLNPVGPCMVSSEGTCAAYFKYY